MISSVVSKINYDVVFLEKLSEACFSEEGGRFKRSLHSLTSLSVCVFSYFLRSGCLLVFIVSD